MHGCVHAHAYKKVVSSVYILHFLWQKQCVDPRMQGEGGDDTGHNKQALLVTCDLFLCFMCCWEGGILEWVYFRLSLFSFHSFICFIYLDLSSPLLLWGEAEWTNGYNGLTAALGLTYTRRHLSVSVVSPRNFRQPHLGTGWGKCSLKFL